METKMVVKTKLILALVLGILVSASLSYAQDLPLTTSINKYAYSPGDNILIYAKVYNINTYPVHVMVESLLGNEEGTYPSAIIPLEFQLSPKEERRILLYNLSVDENFISGTYNTDIRILFNSKEVAKESLRFIVQYTLKEMSVNIKICKNSECSEKTKVFVKGDSIYLDYSSSVENPSVTAVLTYPDKTTKQLTLPASIKAEQIGNYELEITASKQGYKTINKKELLGVIEEEAVIKPKEITKKDIIDLSIVSYGIIIILILIILVYLVQRNWKQKRSKNDVKEDNIRIIKDKLVKAKNLIKEGKFDSVKSLYNEIMLIYDKLPESQSRLIYREVQDLYNKIK